MGKLVHACLRERGAGCQKMSSWGVGKLHTSAGVCLWRQLPDALCTLLTRKSQCTSMRPRHVRTADTPNTPPLSKAALEAHHEVLHF